MYAPARTVVFLMLTGGCAQLHHAQLGDIDDRPGTRVPIDLKVSETGVSTLEGAELAKVFARNGAQAHAAGDLAVAAELAQMGPRTGNPVFDVTYAEGLGALLRAQCPTGELTDLMAVRETRKYPVISGEIVKITGTCLNRFEDKKS